MIFCKSQFIILHLQSDLPGNIVNFARPIKQIFMNWLLLILSGCIELVFTFCLSKVSKTCGSEKALWIIGTVSAIALSLYLVTKVLKTLPIGTAYAVWTGIGAVGTVLIGIIFFHEDASFGRLFFVSTLILSIIGLKIVSN